MADPQSPWGKKPTDSGSTRPQAPRGHTPGPNTGNSGGTNAALEQLLRDAKARMRGGMGSGPGNGGNRVGGEERRIAGFILGGICALWVLSGIYRVNSDELGVVLRFGAYDRISSPGLNYHLPYPFEEVAIPSVTTVNRVEVGFRGNASENPNIRTAKLRAVANDPAVPGNREGLMLTGDRNIIDIDFEVQWKIDATHPEKFLFNMRDPAGNVKAVAESAMREVIGRTKLDDVLTSAQSQIAEDTKTLMQQVFNDYDAGIEIIAVNLSRPDVPSPVIDEFQDVKRAEQDKQTAESVAEGYRNEILPRAKGDAAKMLEDAAAYKSRVVADAQGDASRFKQVYSEYSQAKDVTKRRIYLETMESLLKGMPKVIVESAGKSGGGVLPIMPLTMPSPANAGASQQTAPALAPMAAPSVKAK